MNFRAGRNPEVNSLNTELQVLSDERVHVPVLFFRNSHKLSAMQSYVTSKVPTLLYPISFFLEFSKYVEDHMSIYTQFSFYKLLIIWVLSFCQ